MVTAHGMGNVQSCRLLFARGGARFVVDDYTGFPAHPTSTENAALTPADELQFIDRERIKEAQKREPQSLSDDPLVSGGGAAWNVAALALAVGMPNRSRGSGSPASTRAIAMCW
jgi:hypothetical protein